jgi:hypothetical protein
MHGPLFMINKAGIGPSTEPCGAPVWWIKKPKKPAILLRLWAKIFCEVLVVIMLHYYHRGETYRVVTSVPTFFVRMLGKLLDACIWLDDDLMTTHFKLAEHAQLIIFCPVAWKKVGTWKRKLLQCLRRSVTALYVSTLCYYQQYILQRQAKSPI